MTLTTRQFYKKCSPITITDGKGNLKEIIESKDATKGKQIFKKLLVFLRNCHIEIIENHRLGNYRMDVFLPEYQLAIKTFTPIPGTFRSNSAKLRRQQQKQNRRNVRKLLESTHNIKFIYLTLNSNYKTVKEFVVKQLAKLHKQGICKNKAKRINSVMFSEHLENCRQRKKVKEWKEKQSADNTLRDTENKVTLQREGQVVDDANNFKPLLSNEAQYCKAEERVSSPSCSH